VSEVRLCPVIPAKAGIQPGIGVMWTPAFAGVTQNIGLGSAPGMVGDKQ